MKLNKIFENKKTIKKQQKVALKVLRNLKKNGYKDVVLAGGAPRNWAFGKPANDLDIYVRGHFDASISSLIVGGNDKFKSLAGTSRRYYGGMKNLNGVVETISGDVKIQIISTPCDFSKDINKLFQRFDFGVCKIAWDENGYHASEEFLNDKNNKTLTINKFDYTKFNNIDSFVGRFDKMKDYFPDHRLSINNEAKENANDLIPF